MRFLNYHRRRLKRRLVFRFITQPWNLTGEEFAEIHRSPAILERKGGRA